MNLIDFLVEKITLFGVPVFEQRKWSPVHRFGDSPYLYPSSWRKYKESFYHRLIRGMYYRFIDELYIPHDSNVYMTYGGKDKQGRSKRGFRICHKGLGVQERYFDMLEGVMDKEKEF